MIARRMGGQYTMRVAMDEWMSFEDAMIRLRVTSEELKRWVGEGSLAAFRGPDGAMRFKSEDVERLKSAPPPSPATDVLVIKPTDPLPPPSEPPRDRGAVSIAPVPPAAKPKPAGKKKAKKPAPKKKKKGAPRKKKR